VPDVVSLMPAGLLRSGGLRWWEGFIRFGLPRGSLLADGPIEPRASENPGTRKRLGEWDNDDARVDGATDHPDDQAQQVVAKTQRPNAKVVGLRRLLQDR